MSLPGRGIRPQPVAVFNCGDWFACARTPPGCAMWTPPQESPSPLHDATTTDAMPDLLTDPRMISAACLDAAMGRAAYVYADIDGEKRRIVAARRRRGVLQVKVLTLEHRLWYPAAGAYTD